MPRPDTFWLTLTNIVLAVLVLLCLLVFALGTLCEVLSKLKKRRSYEAELSRDMQEMFAPAHPAGVFHTRVPGPVHRLLEHVCHMWCRLAHRHPHYSVK